MQKHLFDIKDIKQAENGKRRVEWAASQMPVLELLNRQFLREKPLKGIRLVACLHVTTETANLMALLQNGGAEIALCASNPLSTQDDVAAHLVKNLGLSVFAIKGENTATYHKHLIQSLAIKPNLTMDDGADLVTTIHTEKKELLDEVIGGSEETTTGVIRLRAMAKDGALKYPIIAVNDALTKHLFDNRYGTGQSTIDGILRATNILLAGSRFVVCGYGWCGKGVAMRAKGMGAQVIVCEINPLKALEARMDGFEVMPLIEAAPLADIILTVTGNINVVDKHDLKLLKDGVILGNSGHFNVEINIKALEEISESKRTIRDYLEEFTLSDGRKIYLLGEGRLINLAAAEGHPAAVMDMSFANQALSAVYLVKHARSLEKKVYSVPAEIDESVAKLKLAALGVEIDELTPEQEKYLNSWKEGT